MTIYLSENIKRLRTEKGITQENLAEFLGVSFQSVSNWERSEAYPDITLLPMIALYFNVTVDELLGMNKALAEEKTAEYLSIYENNRFKNTHFVYEKFKNAVKEFPTDYRILVRFMELLMCEKSDVESPDYEKSSQKLMSIYDNIQTHCSDDNIRMWAKRLICQHLHSKAHYTGVEEYQLQAEKILSEMPALINTKDYLSTMLISDKEKHYEACGSVIENLLFLLQHSADHYCLYDDAFSVEYKIEALEKMLKIYEIIYNDGNYGKSWLDVIYNYGHLVHLYHEDKNDKKALYCMDMCCELARKYDELPEKSERSAQFFENRIFEKTERGKTMCERMKYLITEKYPLSEDFRKSADYLKCINMLG